MLLAESVLEYAAIRVGYLLSGVIVGVVLFLFVKAVRKCESRINGIENRLESLEGNLVASPSDPVSD